MVERNRIRDASRAGLSSAGVTVLTAIHHVYGAIIYRTRWRLHVLVPAAIALPLIGGLLALHRRRPRTTLGRASLGLASGIMTIGPVATIGMFEGLYNHVLKNALYLGGASKMLMRRLFPPPKYELPNDAFFEITGVLQVVPAAMTAWYLLHLLPRRRAR